MSQTSGLRFDIYERIYLPEDGAGMRELTSIELTPEIIVESQGEQAVLKGYLLLSGSYASVDETRGEEQLTHRIPVEITLPLNRIHSVDDISVDIEQFDVDLLSTRSLNVTGVLSLQGIQMAADPAVDSVDWREEEEVVFTHKAEEDATAAPTPWALAAQAAEEAEINASAAQPEASAEERQEVPAPVAEAAPVINEEPAEAEEQPVVASVAEEKKEIKIAFSGKSEEEIAGESIGGLNSLISAPAAQVRNEPVTAATESPAAASAPTAATAAPQAANAKRIESEGKDRLEWKSLFLSNASDAPQFRRVRMCIAQKEDTVETIAERYKKNARELMLYNRLNDQYLQEGQVVYIP